MASKGITVIDLFCGAGGFSEGFHQAGFDVVYGIDNWKPACETHMINGLGETEPINLLEIDVDKVLAIKERLEKKHGTIDLVIGSPPCTEFSYAKRGGKGDIQKGMLLVRAHLLFVALFKPKYWLMENVPRLRSVLNEECTKLGDNSWSISFNKIGIPDSRLEELGLETKELIIPHGDVFLATDYGAHEKRKRFVAGNFPIDLMYKEKVGDIVDKSLGGLFERLQKTIKQSGDLIEDPNYPGHIVERGQVRDLFYDTTLHPMYWEEMRHLKRRHIQYGRMHLPEDHSAPARTIMATSTSSSRESLIFETDRTVLYQGRQRKLYKQPTVREVACIQGFPIDFQLVASRINDRYKLIGNAVPCQLSYRFAKAISNDIKNDLTPFDRSFKTRVKITLTRQKNNGNKPIVSVPVKILEEANDIHKIHKTYKAKPTKNLRRKLLSSKLEDNSCIVIFENAEINGGKITGSNIWKACIQKGVGKSYSRTYLDNISIPILLSSIESSPEISQDIPVIKGLINSLLFDIDNGIPELTNDWVEFPGWKKIDKAYLKYISANRRSLPAISVFQKMFTSEMPDIGNLIGPIDLFDGMDAVMLKNINDKNNIQLISKLITIDILEDNGNYVHRLDKRIEPKMIDTKIPLITIIAGLITVHTLNKMYSLDADIENEYSTHIRSSDEQIQNWCSTNTKSFKKYLQMSLGDTTAEFSK